MSHTITQHGPLRRLDIDHPAAKAQIYLHGGHLAHWQPAGEEPVLYMSPNSQFAAMKPIRGGVPVCLPWFGPHKTNASLPAHGFARLVEWKLVSVAENDAGAAVNLQLDSSLAPAEMRQGSFIADLRFTVGRTLTMSLAIRNTGDQPLAFEEALHTYFTVADVRRVTVAGLTGVEYISKAEGGVQKADGEAAVRFAGETDRVYLNTDAACVIDDPGLKRQIIVDKTGSQNTVVWNPAVKRATELTDIGPENWQGFVCVETANVGENQIKLEPGKVHEMTAKVSVQSR